jgi:L-serine dehydratase
MTLSAFDLYSIGIGPSSSHTVGPMRAAKRFVESLIAEQRLADTVRVQAELFGSLGATGQGHGTPKAIVLGLEGAQPATVDVEVADRRLAEVVDARSLLLGGVRAIAFDPDTDLVLHRRRTLPGHPNGMTFTAYGGADHLLSQRRYYSVGGGSVADDSATGTPTLTTDATPVRYPFTTGAQLLAHCADNRLSVAEVMWANEQSWRTTAKIRSGLLDLWRAMQACVDRGCHRRGVLPGGLRVPRRAPDLYDRLAAEANVHDPLHILDWLTLYALAVNEENAAGGRVVTAPTNGAAGIIPAVLHYYTRFVPGADDDAVVRFLLTAAAVGILVKENASISGAEVGCQGEVGSACAMAAAGLCAVLGGSPAQVENAAEIGIEHNLGLTCDPVGGLVQIPCIERNAVAAIKAVSAARIALHADGRHIVSLDKVIKTMRETGADMKDKYKETARGGLAVNIIEC